MSTAAWDVTLGSADALQSWLRGTSGLTYSGPTVHPASSETAIAGAARIGMRMQALPPAMGCSSKDSEDAPISLGRIISSRERASKSPARRAVPRSSEPESQREGEHLLVVVALPRERLHEVEVERNDLAQEAEPDLQAAARRGADAA